MTKYTLVLTGILSVCLICTNTIYADYSSLTSKEKETVKKAFRQAKFYQYYEFLVDGKDKITVTKIERIGKKQISDIIVEYLYQVDIDIRIKDKVFKRTTTLRIAWKSKYTAPSITLWDSLKKIGGGVVGGILIGLLLAIVI